MKEMWTFIKILFAGLGGYIGMFLGGWDGPLYALVMFITLDYITGVMCGINERKLSSEIGFNGIFRKVTILILVGVGALLDDHIVRSGDVVRTAIIFYYISNEGVSLIENATRLGLPVPNKIKYILETMKEDEEGNKK